MGGLMHLFDFNQALAGRKLVTEKKSAVGLETPRNSLDVGGSILEPPKPNAHRHEEIPYGYERLKPSAKKKSSAMPIKTLIAHELTKDSESSNRAPSVVARLMGLEALPNDVKTSEKASPLRNEKSVYRPLERQRGNEKPAHNAKFYGNRAISPVATDNVTHRSPRTRGSDLEDDQVSSLSLSFRNHPQEQLLQEFKKEFEARQSQKKADQPRKPTRLDDCDSKSGDTKALVQEKRHEAKLALPQEKVFSSKEPDAEDRLHESNEFLEAMEFLQSNKDLFRTFLQKSNSSTARKLHDIEVTTLISQPKEVVKHGRLHHDAYRSNLFEGGERSDPRASYRAQHSTIKRPDSDVAAERKVKNALMMQSYIREESLSSQGQGRLTSSSVTREDQTYNTDRQTPTRIVVLKPNPGRVHNSRVSPPRHPRSPNDLLVSKEITQKDSSDILEKLWEKLNGKYKHERRSRQLKDHYRDFSKDPREVAREIARQVRETVTRELSADSERFSNSHSAERDRSFRRKPRYNNRKVPELGAGSTNEEASIHPRRIHYDGYNRVDSLSSQWDKSLDNDVGHNYELRRRASERSRSLTAEQSGDLITETPKAAALRNGVYSEDVCQLSRKGVHSDDRCQSSSGLKSSRSSRGSRRHGVDGFNVAQHYQELLLHAAADKDIGDPPLESEIPFSVATGGGMKERSRSKSMPMLETSAHGKELLSNNNGVLFGHAFESGLEEVTGAPAVDVKDHLTGLIIPLDRKEFESYGKITSIGRIPANPEKGCHGPACIELSAQESLEDISVAYSQKAQCQIEDIGPVPDNDSSVSSCDNSPLFSNQILVGESGSANGHHSALNSAARFQVSAETERDNECHSEQPSLTGDLLSKVTVAQESLSCLIAEVPRRTESDSNKEQPEHPSPVSVLSVPFQEDSGISMEFKEISADLQGLRMQLRLLRFDDDSVPIHEQEASQENGCVGGEEGPFMDRSLDDVDTMSESEHPHVEGGEFDSSYGEAAEMMYVKAVLSASGFTGDRFTIWTRWFAPNQPLDPYLFQQVEGYLSGKGPRDIRLDIRTQKCAQLLNYSMRHLLFDCINDVLLEVLGPHLNCRPWSISHNLSIIPIPLSKDLVQLVCSRVYCLSCSQSESQDTLENLVAKDLARGDHGLDLSLDTESVGLDVEQIILNDLIEEALLVL